MEDWIDKRLSEMLLADRGDVETIGGERYRSIGVVPRGQENAIKWRAPMQSGGTWDGQPFDFQSPHRDGGLELWQLIKEFLGS